MICNGAKVDTYIDVSLVDLIDNDMRNATQSILQLPQQSAWKNHTELTETDRGCEEQHINTYNNMLLNK